MTDTKTTEQRLQELLDAKDKKLKKLKEERRELRDRVYTLENRAKFEGMWNFPDEIDMEADGGRPLPRIEVTYCSRDDQWRSYTAEVAIYYRVADDRVARVPTGMTFVHSGRDARPTARDLPPSIHWAMTVASANLNLPVYVEGVLFDVQWDRPWEFTKAPAHTRSIVREFAKTMERELQKNGHKKEAWRDLTVEECIERLREELEELELELKNGDGSPESKHRIGSEAADLGNFAMFTGLVFGDVPEVP